MHRPCSLNCNTKGRQEAVAQNTTLCRPVKKIGLERLWMDRMQSGHRAPINTTKWTRTSVPRDLTYVSFFRQLFPFLFFSSPRVPWLDGCCHLLLILKQALMSRAVQISSWCCRSCFGRFFRWRPKVESRWTRPLRNGCTLTIITVSQRTIGIWGKFSWRNIFSSKNFVRLNTEVYRYECIVY